MTSEGFLCVLTPKGSEYVATHPEDGLRLSEPLAADGMDFAGRGTQPLIPFQGGTSANVQFHGELHGLSDLRQRLGAGDLPTTQVLALAYQRWGDELPHHIDGLYALAILDRRSAHLFRDTSGARNLYYTLLPSGGLVFSTHLETLVQVPGVTRQIAPQGLHEYLRFLDVAAPNTMYQGVYSLKAGHVLTWKPGHPPSIAPVNSRVPVSLPASFEGAQDAVETLLRQAIAQRLEGMSRPGAFLSGGVDSALLCALGSGLRPDLTAVTVGFSGARYDEAPAAAAIARYLGLPHETLRYDRADYLRAFASFQAGAAQPVGDPAAPATLLAFRDCQSHFDALLDGSGADESLGLMPPRHVRVAVEYAALLPTWLRRAGAATLARIPGMSGYSPILDFAHPVEPMIRWRGFTQSEIQALSSKPVDLSGADFFQTFAKFPRQAHFERYSALLDSMPGDRLHDGARLSGLTLRFPYWDPAVDSFIRALPVAWRYLEGQPKRLLRALLARHVPRELWDVPKHGFDFPLMDFLRGDDHALVKRYVLNSPWRDWGILSAAGVEEYARRFLAGENKLMFRVWALAVLAAWLESHDWRRQE